MQPCVQSGVRRTSGGPSPRSCAVMCALTSVMREKLRLVYRVGRWCVGAVLSGVGVQEWCVGVGSGV